VGKEGWRGGVGVGVGGRFVKIPLQLNAPIQGLPSRTGSYCRGEGGGGRRGGGG
jgi:hypothetical protein